VRQGDDLIAQVTVHNRLGSGRTAFASVRVQAGADFATLPKLHINITPLGGVHVFDDRSA